MIKIHDAFSKAAIAVRYYQRVKPERNYDAEAARKQFDQDSKIDRKIVLEVVTEIFKEQKAMLRAKQ